MSKGISYFFLAVSLAFFLFVVGLTGYRIETLRGHNAAEVRDRMTAITARVTSAASAPDAFSSPGFRRDMRALFDAEPRLLLAAVHSPDEGLLYLVTRNRAYLEEPASPSPQWRGTPVYRITRGYELALSSTLGDGPAARTLDGVFVIMGREDLYPIVRDDLYLFLAFLLISGVLILIVTSVSQDVPPSHPSGPPGGGWRPSASSGSPPPRETPSGPAPPPSSGFASGPPSGLPAGQGLTSPRTGLVWAEHLDARLSAELERASASDQDLGVARIHLDERFPDSALSIVYGEIARILREMYPLPDCIFESGSESYSILLPENDIDTAVKSLNALRVRLSHEQIAGKPRSVSIGVTSRGGRLLDGRDLLEEADIAVAKASREGGNRVVGFRADPARFREALSGSRS
ncbi:MAG TPA: hypothetical protein VMV03_02620 [Spirochaetia bacterium]|nr:hypothetical protein [Spirochaetia bacterium]